ncbi:hypothetical protein HBA54_18865 [Pelagibius litoralis]|uniref:Uncharacterized protein n=1 Tax=Pelagibius litoralis TaxID=374515 RepID=A0A967KC28_9PROT|nr:hypothetical protein [Pelagibius litoralis]NIA70664.1 hypothetical protein [Pelagibius litoralis]
MADDNDKRGDVSIFDETLLASSQVRLFGRVFRGLKIDEEGLGAFNDDKRPFNKNPLTDKLDPELKPGLARIYGFSFEGSYYKLQAPYVFLVHGPGVDIKEPTSVADTGIEMKDERFLEGVKMWSYDKVDFSVRIDIVSGWMEEILLDAAIGNTSNMTAGEFTTRADMGARADMTSRADMTARADMAMRSRFKG